jgi:hypothetical protein
VRAVEEARALLAAVISDCPCVDAEDKIVVEEWVILAGR